MAFPRIGGVGINLSANAGIAPYTGGNLGGQSQGLTNMMTLLPGKRYVLPAGTFSIDFDLVANLEFFDPVTNIWRVASAAYSDGHVQCDSDGANIAIANMTGFPVGGLITNAGASYTNGIGTAATGLTITPSAGGSTWVPIVGGAINSSVTITNAGTNFTFAPTLIVDAPAVGGFQSTMTCTISGGAINAVTVVNQGAGYTATNPKITIVNDIRDTTAAGGPGGINPQAVLTATLTGSGTLTGMYPAAGGQGTVLTAVPTFTFSPASTTAATAIMNFAVTSYTQTAGGTGYSTSAVVFSANHIVAGTSVLANPMHNTQLTTPRPCRIVAGLSAGALTTAGQIVEDAGSGIQVVPVLGVLPVISIPTAIATATANVGGVNAMLVVQPI